MEGHKQMIIGELYLEDCPKDKVRLCTKLQFSDREDYTLWFEYSREFKDYIVTDRADAILFSLVYFCMENGYDMLFRNPISSELYLYFTQLLLNTLSAKMEQFSNIKLISETTDEKITGENASATAISAGVDSLFTILKSEEYPPDCRLKYYTLYNVGAFHMSTMKTVDDFREDFNKKVEVVQKFADKKGVSLIAVDSNISELVSIKYKDKVMSRYRERVMFNLIGTTLTLQKLIGKYYISSSFPFDQFAFNYRHSEMYALFLTDAANVTATHFYLVGAEGNRFEKLEYLVNKPETYDTLNVCWHDITHNCGRCSKCAYTMLILDALGHLEKYKDVFDVDAYKSNKEFYQLELLGRSTYGVEEAKKVKQLLMSKGWRFSLSIRFKAFLLRRYHAYVESLKNSAQNYHITEKLSQSKLLKKFFHIG